MDARQDRLRNYWLSKLTDFYLNNTFTAALADLCQRRIFFLSVRLERREPGAR